MLRSLIKPFYLDVRQAILQALIRSGPPPAIPPAIRSLLVIIDGRLGDVSPAIPILQCLRAAYPIANFAIVSPRLLQPLVQWACQPNHLFDVADPGAIANTNWDIAIDLTTDYHLKPARLVAGTHSPVRIGFDVKGRGRYFNLPLRMAETEHMQQTYARVLFVVGHSVPSDALAPGDSSRSNRRMEAARGCHPSGCSSRNPTMAGGIFRGFDSPDSQWARNLPGAGR